MAVIKIFARLLILFHIGYQNDVFGNVKIFTINYDNMKVLKEYVVPKSICISKCSRIPLCESIKYNNMKKICQLSSTISFSKNSNYDLIERIFLNISKFI